MNILAIGAHPDDLEIFAYGFLAAAAARGDNLVLGVATDGAAGGPNPGLSLPANAPMKRATALPRLASQCFLIFPTDSLPLRLMRAKRSPILSAAPHPIW